MYLSSFINNDLRLFWDAVNDSAMVVELSYMYELNK